MTVGCTKAVGSILIPGAEAAGRGEAGHLMISMADALERLPELRLTPEEITNITHGNPVLPAGPGVPPHDRPLRLLNERGELLAVGVVRNGKVWPETVVA